MFIRYGTGVLAPACEILAKKDIGTATLLSELTNEEDADDVIHSPHNICIAAVLYCIWPIKYNLSIPSAECGWVVACEKRGYHIMWHRVGSLGGKEIRFQYMSQVC